MRNRNHLRALRRSSGYPAPVLLLRRHHKRAAHLPFYPCLDCIKQDSGLLAPTEARIGSDRPRTLPGDELIIPATERT